MTHSDYTANARLRRNTTLKSVTALGLFFTVVFVGIDWAPANAARNDLRKLYGSTDVRIVSIKINNLNYACGGYLRPGGHEPLRFLEQHGDLWAQRSVSNAGSDQEIAAWNKCMTYYSRGNMPPIDWLEVQLLRLT